MLKKIAVFTVIAVLFFMIPGAGCYHALAGGGISVDVGLAVSHSAMSVPLFVGIQRLINVGFKNFDFRQNSQLPYIAGIIELNPASEFHRDVLGTLTKHLGNEAIRDLEALGSMRSIDPTYAEQIDRLESEVATAFFHASPDMARMVRSKINDLAKKVNLGDNSSLRSTCRELDSFKYVLPANLEVELHAVSQMAKAANGERTILSARQLAWKLLAYIPDGDYAGYILDAGPNGLSTYGIYAQSSPSRDKQLVNAINETSSDGVIVLHSDLFPAGSNIHQPIMLARARGIEVVEKLVRGLPPDEYPGVLPHYIGENFSDILMRHKQNKKPSLRSRILRFFRLRR
ncbi:MAG: hypothetical protein HY551_00200 [Elusimicrobia bacterium]|nr:hypothetical protein [Elusimicrobiota bacterium]